MLSISVSYQFRPPPTTRQTEAVDEKVKRTKARNASYSIQPINRSKQAFWHRGGTFSATSIGMDVARMSTA